MSFTRDDKENRKFESDPTDSSKVVVKTKVENQASDPVPVSIVNPDSNIDLEVTIQPNITIDDSTPIDVNISNTAVATNATIQGTPAVSVTGNVDIDDATAIRVDVTNAAVATNATVQNSFINVYDKLYNGSSWVNQLSDNDGRAIVLNKKYYSAADITALGSSTSVREWVSAYSDDILEYKYVQTFDDEHPAVIYYTHPDLGDSNKCLKFSYTYTTQNSVKVVQSVFITVVDWTFDSAVTGTVTLTLGTITSPNPSSAIAVGTDICTVAAAASGGGAITLSLSGTNASLYTLRNVTDGTTGASLAYDAAKTFVLETASDFSGSSYSHSVTITATEASFGLTTSSNVATSGTYVAGSSWANDKYITGTPSGTNIDEKRGFYTTTSFTTNKGWFPSIENGATDRFHELSGTTVSFWYKGPSSDNYRSPWYTLYNTDASTEMQFFGIWLGNSRLYAMRYNGEVSGSGGWKHYNLGVSSYTDWTHIVLTIPQNSSSLTSMQSSKLYINGSENTSTGTSNGGADLTNYTVYRNSILARAPQYSTSDTTYSYYGSHTNAMFMDELTTWSKELSSAEVTELYNSGTPADPESHSADSDLERYVSCGDAAGDGSSIKDNLDATYTLTNPNSDDLTASH